MTKPVSTPLALLAKAYTFEELRLDPRAGIAIGDKVWINLARSVNPTGSDLSVEEGSLQLTYRDL